MTYITVAFTAYYKKKMLVTFFMIRLKRIATFGATFGALDLCFWFLFGNKFIKYVSVLIYSIFLANVKTFLILYNNIRNKTGKSVFTITSTTIHT